jgi:hypothetical protein
MLLGVIALGAQNPLGVRVGVPALPQQQLQQKIGVPALHLLLQRRHGVPVTRRVQQTQTVVGAPAALHSRAAGRTGAPAVPSQRQHQQQQAGTARGEPARHLRSRQHRADGGISLLLAQGGMVGGVRSHHPQLRQLLLLGANLEVGVKCLRLPLLLQLLPGLHRKGCRLLTCLRLSRLRLSRHCLSRWVLYCRLAIAQ